MTVLAILIFQGYPSSLIILYNIRIFVLLESLFGWDLFSFVQSLYELCLICVLDIFKAFDKADFVLDSVGGFDRGRRNGINQCGCLSRK